VGPDARIGGDAVAIGGVLMTSEGAVIQGDRVELTGIIGQNVGRNNGSELFGAFASSFASFAQVVGAFLVSALLLAFVPRRLSVVEDQLRTSPGRSALTGLAMLVAFLPLLGALTISIIGIPLIPVAIMVLAVVLVMGMAALALRIGHALPFWGEHRSAMGALALGYLAIGLVALVPWVGAVVVPLASFYAGGAVLASRFGAQARAGHGP
jgi:hypothetical protein